MKTRTRKAAMLFVLVAAAGVLCACRLPAFLAPERPQPSAPTLPPATIPTAVPTPTANPAPIPAAQPTRPSGQAGGVGSVKVFMIALEDDGASGKKIGCGDSVVPVEVSVQPTNAVLRAALTHLLGVQGRDYGQSGLYNALYQSDLRLDDLNLTNGTAVIRLSGTLKSGGVCDGPRIQAQLEETARQFSTVQRLEITVNGRKLEEVLSGKG